MNAEDQFLVDFEEGLDIELMVEEVCDDSTVVSSIGFSVISSFFFSSFFNSSMSSAAALSNSSA